MCKISIITVVYNQKSALAETILNIQQQSFDDYEHLIIDGASTDGTLEVIEANESRLRYISEPDKGLYDAMNKGIKLACGAYILFMNAGDLLYRRDSLENIFTQSNEEDLIYADAVVIDEWNNEKPWHKKTPPDSEISAESFLNGAVICHQCMIMKREKALLYDLQWKIVADLDWSIRCVKDCHSFYYHRQKFCKFRRGGLSDKQRAYALYERFRLFVKHFGITRTIMQHVYFFGGAVLKKFREK